ncbi:MAG: metallophosphoesterase [Clostridia bacterium]|nr:metallophosphoesterase [Clostridia bacterium]
MPLYTIADLHLSTLSTTNKSMEVFGARWTSYMEKIEKNWRHLITDDDTVVIPGDISWALSLDEATSDLKFLDSLPGKKILGKGNHDFWWTTMKKHSEHFEKNGINSISFLFNNAYECDGFIVAGTRGWFFEEKNATLPNKTDFAKLVRREELRLETSLKAASELRAASGNPIIAFMHFPPVFGDEICRGLIDILKKYEVRTLYYGHIHGNYTIPEKISFEGIDMHIISADYISFVPKRVF